MTNQCEHGQLARVCPLCEKDERIRVLREALEVIHGQSGNDYAHDIFEARAIARAALEQSK